MTSGACVHSVACMYIYDFNTIARKKLINRHRVQPFLNTFIAVLEICYDFFFKYLSNLFY